MKQETLALGKNTTLKIANVPSDLRITGWDRDEIRAKTSGKILELLDNEEQISLTCDNDLIISLPKNTQIEIGNIGGDATLRELSSPLKLAEVGGDLVMRHIAKAEIGDIGGDLVLRHAETFHANKIGSDASIRDVSGEISIANIGSDLHLREIQGNLNTKVGNDAIIYLHPQKGAEYNLTAGGDVFLRLPNNADLEMALSAGGDLSINLPDIEKTDEKIRTLMLGLASAKLTFSAGNDLRVTSKSDTWSARADFDIDIPFSDVDFDGLGDDFAENITCHFDTFPDKFFEKLSLKMDTFPDELMDKITRKVDASARKTEKKIHKTEQKIRRAEHKISKAERKAERKAARHAISFGGRKPSPPPMPVSDDERLLILKMLQEKKISADDAEKLLSALEA